MTDKIRWQHWLTAFILVFGLAQSARAEKVTLQVRDTELAEVVEMIARQQQVNILLSGDVEGTVSLSLFDSPLDDALTAVANAAGYALERQGRNYFIVSHDQVGRYQNGSLTEMRVYDVDYADGEQLAQVIEDHLSLYGKVNFVAQQSVLIVQDQQDFLRDIGRLIEKIDRRPRQVLIEAKILEVTLNEDENLGIDWADLFNSNGGSGAFGMRGNTSGTGADGFFFDLVTPDVEVALNALQEEGRLHTLSTPKLVALENQEASVVIGDRRGYQVTTTINQVTTESIEFLESGVILRVTAQIDGRGQVLMSVHPEVSTGTVDVNGIPSQTTTEVTTNLLIPTGETVFIGGLIKQTESRRRSSVPGLNRVPVVRRLFSGHESNQLTTETVVLIRPIIAEDVDADWNRMPVEKAGSVEFTWPELEPWRLSASVEDRVQDRLQGVADAPDLQQAPVTTPLAQPVAVEAGAGQQSLAEGVARQTPVQQPATQAVQADVPGEPPADSAVPESPAPALLQEIDAGAAIFASRHEQVWCAAGAVMICNEASCACEAFEG